MRALKPSIVNTSKSPREKPNVAISPPSLRDSAALDPLVPHDTLLPVAAVEMFVLEPAQVHTLEASHIDVDAVGIGARNIERCNAAIRAEEMLGDFRVEGVGHDVIGRCDQPERGPLNDPVEVALLRANRAVAFRDALELALHFEADASTVASAAVGSFVWFFSHERSFNAALAARKPGWRTKLRCRLYNLERVNLPGYNFASSKNR